MRLGLRAGDSARLSREGGPVLLSPQPWDGTRLRAWVAIRSFKMLGYPFAARTFKCPHFVAGWPWRYSEQRHPRAALRALRGINQHVGPNPNVQAKNASAEHPEKPSCDCQ